MSDWDDETLRRAYAASRQQRAALPSDARPDVDDIAAAIDGVSADRERILDEALTSGAADELALLQAVHHASGQSFAKTTQTHRPATQWRSRWPLAAAAVVLLAIGLPTVRYLRPPAEPETVRAAANADETVILVSPASGTTLAADLVFRWRSVPATSSYLVELLDDRGQVRLRRETQDTTWTMSAGAELRDAASATGWWVIARQADGTTRRSVLRLLRAAEKP